MKRSFNIPFRISIFIVGVIISFKVLYSTYDLPNMYFLIPVTYSILILVTKSVTKFMMHHIGLLALNITMLIRYLVSPLLISMNGLEMVRGIYPSEKSYNVAVNLMLYEMVLIFVVFQLLYKLFYKNKFINKVRVSQKRNIFGWVFVFLCLGISIVYPEILSRYTFILTANELKSKDLGIEIFSFLPLLIQLGTLVLTISLINIIYNRYKKYGKFKYVAYSVVVVFIISSFIIGTSRFSVILPLVSGLYIIYLLYSNYRRPIIMISAFTVIFIVLSTSVLKASTISSEDTTIKSFFLELNSNFQLYFSGLNNVAIAVQTASIYPVFDFQSIFSDIFRSVVFINSFFNSPISALTSFNIVFYNGGASRDQILPMVGQGYLYFGFLLAPLFTVVILITMMWFDNKVINVQNIMFKYIYVYISLKFGLFMMTNFTNLLSFFTNFFIILFVVFYMNNKFVRSPIRGGT